MTGAASAIPWVLHLVLHLAILLVAPIFMVGFINRTKAIWAGRMGPNLNQFFFDLRRLLWKAPVYSEVSSWIFPVAPWVALATGLAAALLSPWVKGYAPISFSYDFIYFSYLLGIGRVFMILGALDTGSSFEGMGASREATYSALIEPAFFFCVGTLGILSGHTSFRNLLRWEDSGPAGWIIKIPLVAALFVLLQIEAARAPVDDPQTHLELTMIHEVMILDHGGPELAAIQYGAALKLVTLAGLIAAIINPFSASDNAFAAWGASVGLIAAISVAIGLVESLIARLRLGSVPAYAGLGVLAGAASLLLSLLSRGVAS